MYIKGNVGRTCRRPILSGETSEMVQYTPITTTAPTSSKCEAIHARARLYADVAAFNFIIRSKKPASANAARICDMSCSFTMYNSGKYQVDPFEETVPRKYVVLPPAAR